MFEQTSYHECPMRSVMKTDRQFEPLSVIDKTRVLERWGRERSLGIIREPVPFLRDADPVVIDLAVHVLVMKDDQRVGPGRNVLKIATSLAARHLHDHEPHCSAQHISGEALRGIEQRAVDRANTVSDAQYRDVDPRTCRHLSSHDAGFHEYQ